MSAANLINLNVDTLFEQHSVPEIDIIQKKIQAVVENKREELRTMVGERYRDLLKAADTIGAMQDSSSTLITQVESITNNCRSLNEQQLIGFKTSDATDMIRTRSANKQLDNYFGTMVQIKLLTALPELIWSHIDRQCFYTATELFIFSRHVSTGLQLDVYNPLIHALPVAKKQWEILKPFHMTIKQNVMAVLEREELSAEVTVDCLLSLLLLEKTNLNGLLKTFLQFRCTAFLNSLTDGTRPEGEKRRVKERILASLKVLNSTITLITQCFLENGLVFQKLAEHSKLNALPTIALMDSNDTQFSYMLPEIISSFRPKLDAQTLDQQQLRSAIEQWLEDISHIADVQLHQLFILVTTMTTIQELKIEVNSIKSDFDFTILSEKCQISQSLNFYETKYAPLISQRVRNIIRDSWLKAMERTFNCLQSTLQSIQQYEDYSIKSQQLWEDISSDLPQSLADALSEERKIKKLLMKLKGYDDSIILICTHFDKQLAEIVSEMSVLLEEQATQPENKLALIEFLRELAQQQVTEFITKVKNLQIPQQKRQQLLLVVRLLSALVELCPNLKICFCQQSSWRQHIGQITLSSSDAWQRMCLLIEEEALQFWLRIINGILDDNPCKKYLPKEISYEAILTDFTSWETITLEQKDEQDNPVHPIFRIPSQPRISLQGYLFHVIRSLNCSIPQTLPPHVLQTFNNQLLTELLAHYETLASSTQNVALQLYFDLKFLQSVFAISRDDRKLCEQFQALIIKLKETIDPFDFELFAEHLSNNIKRSVSKLNCQLGVLTQHDLCANSSVTSNSVANERDPNVLSLSSNGSTAIWFPLLPIIDANASDRGPFKERRNLTSVEMEKQTTPTRKSAANARKSDASKSKSGAAAFFGAMSQEWFR